MSNIDLKLNLPKNKISSKLDFKSLDNNYIQLSKSESNQNFIGLEFILLDGPPYVNGELHFGHIINRTIKDHIIRNKLLDGKRISYVIGSDCHGLPIESVAIKQLKIDYNKKKDNEVLIKNKCKEIVDKFIDLQNTQLKYMNFFTYDTTYSTNSIQYMESILRVLWTLVKNNYIRYIKKPNFYSIKEQTNLAFAEITYLEKQDYSLVFKAKIINSNIYILVWTTQPWTILGNKFIGVSNKIKYCIAEENNFQYLVSLDYANINKLKILEIIDISEFINEQYIILDDDKPKNIIFASNIIDNNGTGFLHIAPAHGFEDFQVSIDNLTALDEIENCIDELGFATHKNFCKFSLSDDSLNKEIINYLNNRNLVYFLGKINHRYPFSSRSNTPLYIYSTYQIMITIYDQDKYETIDNFKNTIWCASEGFNTFQNTINQRPNLWCITRQRYWGTPCMLIINDNNNIIYNAELNEYLLDMLYKYGIDFWYDDEFMYGILSRFNLQKYLKNRILHVLDVWFESGVVAINLYRSRLNIKEIDVIAEGKDQHRGWFSSIGLLNTITKSNIKINSIIVHGFACVSTSKKFSKSDKSTSLISKQILSSYHIEIIKLCIFNSDFTYDIIVNENRLDTSKTLYLSIYNLLRFFTNILCYQNKSFYVSNISDIDIYIYNKFIKSYNSFKTNCTKYKINQNSKHLFDMIDHANEYIRISKDSIYCDFINNDNVQNALYIMSEMMLLLCKAVYTICPSLTLFILKNNYNYNSEYELIQILIKHKILEINVEIDSKIWDYIYEIYNIFNVKLDFYKKNKSIKSSLELDMIIIDKHNKYDYMFNIVQDIARIIDTSNVIYINKHTKQQNNVESNIIDVFQYNDLEIKIRKISNILYKCIRCWNYNSHNPDSMCYRCNNVLHMLKK